MAKEASGSGFDLAFEANQVSALLGAGDFGRLTMEAIIDRRVSDKAFRLLAVVSAAAWPIPVPLKYADMARALRCSERQVIRDIRTLESIGRLKV